ncbi:DUF4145 domain-containing protein [Candidatus Woesearchaeota archaeon]|nr:DUF4145 domain-containing protein [Candidatus Woesearchaeota archaeon]
MGVIKLNYYDLNGVLSSSIVLNTDEDVECPFCHRGIEMQPLCSLFVDDNDVQVFMKCKRCKKAFIGYTERNRNGYYTITGFSKGNRKTIEIEKEIAELSPIFIQIYTEADIAEQEKLMQICGVGYRKALEFLIKDYLIKRNPNMAEEIKEKKLSNCINDDIENPRIKEIAKKATWLGNDETHYVRKWEDKDLKDLKTLIKITVNFIHNELLADKYNEDMEVID